MSRFAGDVEVQRAAVLGCEPAGERYGIAGGKRSRVDDAGGPLSVRLAVWIRTGCCVLRATACAVDPIRFPGESARRPQAYHVR